MELGLEVDIPLGAVLESQVDDECADVASRFDPVVHLDDGLVGSEVRVEMRRRMVPIVHRDHDAEEPTQLGHRCSIASLPIARIRRSLRPNVQVSRRLREPE
jgi:hypothetical protein